MKSKRKLIAVFSILVASLIAAKLLFLKETFLYAGTIETTKVDIPARVNSVISKREVNEGDSIQKGQTLLTLTCEDYKLSQDMANRDCDYSHR